MGLTDLINTARGPGALRMALALAVVVSHLSAFDIGTPAVFAFFILSGYWVMRMYEEKYRPHYGDAIFYLSRFLRLWLLFAAVFVAVFLARLQSDPDFGAGHLVGLLMLGVASGASDILAVAWSLDIEMQFYLLVPLFFLIGRWMARRPGPLPGLALVGAVTALTLLGWMLGEGFGLVTVLMYLPFFVIGMAIFLTGSRATGRAAAISAALFLGFGLLIALTPMTGWLLDKAYDARFPKFLFGLAWVALLVPFISWNVSQPSDRLDRHLGNISYPLYLTHWPVIALYGEVVGLEGKTDKAIVLVVTLVAATLVYWALDMRFDAFRAQVVRDAAGRRRRAA